MSLHRHNNVSSSVTHFLSAAIRTVQHLRARDRDALYAHAAARSTWIAVTASAFRISSRLEMAPTGDRKGASGAEKPANRNEQREKKTQKEEKTALIVGNLLRTEEGPGGREAAHRRPLPHRQSNGSVSSVSDAFFTSVTLPSIGNSS